MVRRFRTIAAIAIMGASLGLAACGDDDDEGGATTGGGAAATTQAAEGAASGVEQASIDLAAQYTGVTPGKVDSSLEPLKIGFVNQQGGTPAFPEMEAVAEATVKFVNEHLGGVAGHALELDKCTVVAEEDGQKCAAQMLNDGVKITNYGLTVVGNGAFYKTVKEKFPVIVSAQGGGPDVTTKGVYLLDPGGAAMIGGMPVIAAKLGAKSVAVISSDNPAGKFAIENLLGPAAKKAGVAVKTVYVADTGTTPDYASALQAAGAAKADAVLQIPANAGACTSMFDAMKQLNITVKVVATYTCYGDPFPEHAGDALESWYFSGFTNNPRIEADEQAQAYRNVMTTYGADKEMFLGQGLKEFQDIMLITRFATEIGFDKITPAALDAKIRAYRGPGFLVPGDLKCDGTSPGQPGVCGTVSGSSTYKDGAFVPFDV